MRIGWPDWSVTNAMAMSDLSAIKVFKKLIALKWENCIEDTQWQSANVRAVAIAARASGTAMPPRPPRGGRAEGKFDRYVWGNVPRRAGCRSLAPPRSRSAERRRRVARKMFFCKRNYNYWHFFFATFFIFRCRPPNY